MNNGIMSSRFNPFTDNNTFTTGMLTPLPQANTINFNMFSNHNSYSPFADGDVSLEPINLTGSGFNSNFNGISTKQLDIEGKISPINSSLPTYDEVTNAIPEEVGEVEDLAEGSAFEAGPEGAMVEAGRMTGSFINSGLNALEQNNLVNSYQNSLATSHGIGAQQVANAQFSSGEGLLNIHNFAGSAGAFLGGPLGALLGRGIASFFDTNPNLNIANSSSGSFNPQSTDVSTSQSQSSAELLPD